MRVSSLAAVSGVSVASIKFYLREGLLPAGRRTRANSALYGPEHLRRIRLIRALREVGGVTIEGIATICRVLDEPGSSFTTMMTMIGCVADALGPPVALDKDADLWAAAAADLEAFLAANGLPHRPESIARAQLTGALVGLRRHLNPTTPAFIFAPYVEAMRSITAWERESASLPGSMGITGEGPSAVLEAVVYGTILFEPAILAIRRLLHEYHELAAAAAPEAS